MRLVRDPRYGEVDLTASAEELARLADAVADGEGRIDSTAPPGTDTLAGVEVERTAGPGVLIRHDPGRRTLVISGDPAARAVLADNLRAVAATDDGGHLHVDHHPGHYYLAAGSVPLIVNHPHGAMPTR
ncbi:hypothetical protein ACIQBJ_01815 [Kitasatospora sp. NPDC088391]|uniref:Imm32 family immunity protein n=1 Tax=Kitasatospora sp. NPDC088391 TaxID=3364074 RepID=UPI0038073422